MEGKIRGFSRNKKAQESSGSDSYEENSKNILTYGQISIYTGLRSNVVCIALKVTYSNKTVFFRDELGKSKYNISPWSLRSLQRDMGGHKCVIYLVPIKSPITDAP